jgi:hypothetical protein
MIFMLRLVLLEHRCYSDTIPAAIRRAVTLRDKHCAWPGCDTPAAACDVHHLTHQQDGGPTRAPPGLTRGRRVGTIKRGTAAGSDTTRR